MAATDISVLSTRLLMLESALTSLRELAERTDSDDDDTRNELSTALTGLDQEAADLLHRLAPSVSELLGSEVILTPEILCAITATEARDILTTALTRRHGEIRLKLQNALAGSSRPAGAAEGDGPAPVPGRLAGAVTAIGIGVLAATVAGPLAALLIHEAPVAKAIEGAVTGLITTAANEAYGAARNRRGRRLGPLTTTQPGSRPQRQTGDPVSHGFTAWHRSESREQELMEDPDLVIADHHATDAVTTQPASDIPAADLGEDTLGHRRPGAAPGEF